MSTSAPTQKAPATSQRKLVLDDLPTLALATVETARHQLPGHDEDDIGALVDDGQLLYAWDIGMGEHARELRILPDCIAHYKTTLGHRPFPRSDKQVIADLVKALRAKDKPFTRGTDLEILLNCSAWTITNLIKGKALRVVPGTTWGPGPNGSAVITLASFEKFLVERRAI